MSASGPSGLLVLSADNRLQTELRSSQTFCCLLIALANRLDPDQARHFVGPDLDPNCLTP